MLIGRMSLTESFVIFGIGVIAPVLKNVGRTRSLIDSEKGWVSGLIMKDADALYRRLGEWGR